MELNNQPGGQNPNKKKCKNGKNISQNSTFSPTNIRDHEKNEDELDLPEDIAALLAESAAANFLSDEATQEYQDTFDESKLIIDQAENVERIQELDSIIAKSSSSALQTELAIAKNATHLNQLQAQIQEQGKEHDEIIITSKNPNINFPSSSGYCSYCPSSWKLIGGVIGLILVLIVIIIGFVLFLL